MQFAFDDPLQHVSVALRMTDVSLNGVRNLEGTGVSDPDARTDVVVLFVMILIRRRSSRFIQRLHEKVPVGFEGFDEAIERRPQFRTSIHEDQFGMRFQRVGDDERLESARPQIPQLS